MLRPYQIQAEKQLSEKLNKGLNKVLLYLVTGSGKTVIAKNIIEKILSSNKKVMFLVKGVSLIHQTYDRLKSDNEIGMIQGSSKGKINYKAPLQIASVDTLLSRKKSIKYYLKEFDYVFVDEAHEATSDGYKEVLGMFINARFIGMTATPFAINGRCHSFWEDFVQPITGEELVEQNYLCPIRAFAAPIAVSIKGASLNSAGDYNTEKLYENVSDPTLYSSFEKEFNRHASGKNTITFCVNLKHVKDIVYKLKLMGVENIYQIDSSLSIAVNKNNLKKIREDLAHGLKVNIVSVNMINKGIDLPELEVALCLRPTTSVCLFYQQIGRIMRIADNKPHAKLIDFTNNSYQYGNPQIDNRLPELRASSHIVNQISLLKTCPDCFFLNLSKWRKCMNCGASLVNRRAKRDIKFDESVELKELRKNIAPIKRDYQEFRKTMDNYKASEKIYDIYGDDALQLKEFSKRYRAFVERKDSISFSGWVK